MTIDFNSRTHVECDIGLTTTERRLFISTHALTWSATCTESIFSRQSSGFQLTHSRGVRHPYCYFCSDTTCISTHALTWSATLDRHSASNCYAHFNSRTHVECDREVILVEPDIMNFNSRTHVECDFWFSVRHFSTCNFNSRTHVECDQLSSQDLDKPHHFNSRTHVECDDGCPYEWDCQSISTHALTWSATSPPMLPM